MIVFRPDPVAAVSGGRGGWAGSGCPPAPSPYSQMSSPVSLESVAR